MSRPTANVGMLSQSASHAMGLVDLSVVLDAVVLGMDVGDRAVVVVAAVAGGRARWNLEHGHEIPVEECVQHEDGSQGGSAESK